MANEQNQQSGDLLRMIVETEDGHDLTPYLNMLAGIGEDAIKSLDLEYARSGEGEWPFRFQDLTSIEQAQLLEIIARTLVPTARPYRTSPTSYLVKHTLERACGVYTTNLQTKVAFALLGYPIEGTRHMNPRIGITSRSFDALHDEHLCKTYKRRVDGVGIAVVLHLFFGEAS